MWAGVLIDDWLIIIYVEGFPSFLCAPAPGLLLPGCSAYATFLGIQHTYDHELNRYPHLNMENVLIRRRGEHQRRDTERITKDDIRTIGLVDEFDLSSLRDGSAETISSEHR